MMTNSRSKIFKVSTRTSFFAAFLCVGATCFPIYLAKHFGAPPSVQSLDALLELSDRGTAVFVFATDVEAIA